MIWRTPGGPPTGIPMYGKFLTDRRGSGWRSRTVRRYLENSPKSRPGFPQNPLTRLLRFQFRNHFGIISRTSSIGTVRPASASFMPRSIAARVSASTSTLPVAGTSSFRSIIPHNSPDQPVMQTREPHSHHREFCSRPANVPNSAAFKSETAVNAKLLFVHEISLYPSRSKRDGGTGLPAEGQTNKSMRCKRRP
jgi:hypothetical protein